MDGDNGLMYVQYTDYTSVMWLVHMLPNENLNMLSSHLKGGGGNSFIILWLEIHNNKEIVCQGLNFLPRLKKKYVLLKKIICFRIEHLRICLFKLTKLS